MGRMPVAPVNLILGEDEFLAERTRRSLIDAVRADLPEGTDLEVTTLRASDVTVPELIDAQVCTYTMTPDEEFIIDRLPGRILIAGGDSGEGFKFTSLMGEILADLAEDRPPAVNLDAFRVTRFASAA